MRRTKIVCTIGPSSDNPETLEKIIRAGMNVARLNFSHGTQDEHAAKIRLIREISARLNLPVAILQDLAGPKIRVGAFASGPITLKSNDRFILTARPVPGDAREVSLTYPDLPNDVKAGDSLLLADGALEFKVESVKGPDILCRVITGGILSSHKGINLPTSTIKAPLLTEKDRGDLAFGLKQGVDYVALSFVRSAADVRTVRDFMKTLGIERPLIAKIEKHEALDNIDEIVAEVDGIMVARGDLGVETMLERIPCVQKMIIEKANRAGRPVITATQMLKSMVDAPRPTRAEVTDVANAVLDGTDAVMLSEESASGHYPVESVETLARVAVETEAMFPCRDWLHKFEITDSSTDQEAVARAACELADDIHPAAILTSTQSGSTSRFVAKFRPAQTILAATPSEETYRRLALVWGCIPLMIAPASSVEEMERQSFQAALRSGIIKPGNTVILTAGVPLHVPGKTNLIKVAQVPAMS